MSKAIGIDDSVNQCSCCGKSGLKFTVIVELDCGEVVNYGSVCATKNTGKSKSTIAAEIKSAETDTIAAALTELKSTEEFKNYQQKISSRPRTLVGKSAYDFVKREYDSYNSKLSEISTKYGIPGYKIA